MRCRVSSRIQGRDLPALLVDFGADFLGAVARNHFEACKTTVRALPSECVPIAVELHQRRIGDDHLSAFLNGIHQFRNRLGHFERDNLGHFYSYLILFVQREVRN